MKAPIAIGAAVGLLLLAMGVGVGRYTAPARVEYHERVVTKTVEVAAKQKEENHRENAAERIATVTKWKIREVRTHDGIVERTAEGETGTRAESEAGREDAKRETEIRYVDRKVEVEKIKVVETEKANWAVDAGAGLSTGLRATYRGAIERRIIGPLWLGLWADTTKTAGLSARVEW